MTEGDKHKNDIYGDDLAAPGEGTPAIPAATVVLLRDDPDPRVLMLHKTSKIAFGGRDFATLYVTSLAGLTAGTDQPQAGGIFALTVPGVQGLPSPRMRR